MYRNSSPIDPQNEIQKPYRGNLPQSIFVHLLLGLGLRSSGSQAFSLGSGLAVLNGLLDAILPLFPEDLLKKLLLLHEERAEDSN